MDAIVKMLEKHQPFFEKISRNIYLQAIKDGFLGCMPIVSPLRSFCSLPPFLA